MRNKKVARSKLSQKVSASNFCHPRFQCEVQDFVSKRNFPGPCFSFSKAKLPAHLPEKCDGGSAPPSTHKGVVQKAALTIPGRFTAMVNYITCIHILYKCIFKCVKQDLISKMGRHAMISMYFSWTPFQHNPDTPLRKTYPFGETFTCEA